MELLLSQESSAVQENRPTMVVPNNMIFSLNSQKANCPASGFIHSLTSIFVPSVSFRMSSIECGTLFSQRASLYIRKKNLDGRGEIL